MTILIRMNCEESLGSWPPRRGYRIAYDDFLRNKTVYAPIGIHWIVRWTMRAWLWTFKSSRTARETALREIYDAGFKAGRAAGVAAANASWMRATNQVLGEIDAKKEAPASASEPRTNRIPVFREE